MRIGKMSKGEEAGHGGAKSKRRSTVKQDNGFLAGHSACLAGDALFTQQSAAQPGEQSHAERQDSWARIRHRLFHTLFRFTRPMTLGVRAVIIDDEDRVFMVRQAMSRAGIFGRRCREQARLCSTRSARRQRRRGIAITGTPRLHGMFFNKAASPRDHVAVFVVEDFNIEGIRSPSYEIAETAVFPIDALPQGVTRGSRQRIAEIFHDAPVSETWS